jgi:hypothetical protein
MDTFHALICVLLYRILRFPLMNEPAVHSHPSTEKVAVSVQLDPDLLEQLKHLTNDPSKVIEVAIRQWLRSQGGREDELARTLKRNPPVPPRGEWND